LEDIVKKPYPQLILCPTDYSELATYSLQYAKHVAAGFGAKLLVLHADTFLPPSHFTSSQVDELIRSLQLSRQAAHDHLAEYVKHHVGDAIPTELMFAEERAVPAIVTTAAERGVGLIVMGTHGRSGLTRTMLGSVTERVLRETDCPVLTVRQREPSAGTPPEFIKHILCPVNFTEVAQHALEYAVSMAECFNAALSVLHVIEESTAELDGSKGMDRLCGWIPENLATRCHIQEVVLEGKPAEQILSMAKSGDHDMIVIGAEHKRFFDSTVIGTTTVRVTRHAPCPVLTVVQK
jgi:nucleotide-binding universal stress UspA family protein